MKKVNFITQKNDSDKDIFYSKLVESLIKNGYRFSANDFSKKDANTDHDVLSSSIRLALKVAPLILHHHPLGGSKINPNFDQQKFQQELDKITAYGTIVCFKYNLTQPTIVAVAEADELSQDQMVKLVNKFDESIIEMREFTGRMGVNKLSVTGILIFVFFNPASASKFDESMQKKCKLMHIWKKTYVVTWAIDISNRNLKRHIGLPIIINQQLNSNEIIKAVFQ